VGLGFCRRVESDAFKGWGEHSDAECEMASREVADAPPTCRRALLASVFARPERDAGRMPAVDTRSVRASSDCARSLHSGWRQPTLSRALRIPREVPTLIRFLHALPRTTVRLTDSPAGVAIAEHLSLTRWGIPRFRLAQGVLYLPSDFATYLRGRRRQAVRTNVRRARDLGIDCHSTTVSEWTRPDEKLDRTAPVEHWRATSRSGATVGEAWLTVDDECALLHSLTCSERYARWLLHTAIVERLCAAGCRLLLTNSFDVPLMTPGQQYFQRLLGYSIARVRLHSSSATLAVRRRVPMLVSSIVAIALIVGQQSVRSPFHLAGHRALVWLAAMVAVRVAANRAGWATLVGAGAALGTALTGALPAVSLAYLLCGFALDTVLVLLPGLATNALAMAFAGPAVMVATVIAPAFPTLGHHRAGAAWAIPPILGAIVFGAAAAVVGYYIGRRLLHASPAPLHTRTQSVGGS
jgi:hypothetical protein